MTIVEKVEAMYLDAANYKTVGDFAAAYHIPVTLAVEIVSYGRQLQEIAKVRKVLSDAGFGLDTTGENQ